jgi:DNA-binding transcriptional ArsR family regulator
VNDVETLRAMSDPLRLAILRLLMFDADVTVRVMSAKEIAAELGEPQTKLYRHLKQLEDAKLIEVAETRVVSGIIEQRYRTAQLDVRLSPALIGDTDVRGDLMTTVGAVIDEFGQELSRNVRANRIDMRPFSDPESVGLILQVGYARRMNVGRAREFRDRLAALIDEFEGAAEDAAGTDVHMLVGWYGVPERAADA